MFDLIIIGGSAAATSAGIYAVRRGLNFKIITKEFGGEVATSGVIENWPGVVSTNGLELAEQFKNHLLSNHVAPEEGVEVSTITKNGDGSFTIDAGDKKYDTKTVIVATGVHPRKLNVLGEEEFRNKGVTYCTTCDGPLFSGKVTTVVGGGNSALESALMLAEIASKVYLINKNSKFKGEQVLIDKVTTNPKIEVIYSGKTTEIKGEQLVTGIVYTDLSGLSQELKTDGVFIHVGMTPNSEIFPKDVLKDQFGQILVDDHCATRSASSGQVIAGLFAAGDVTNVPFKQIVIAAGQGCIATLSAVEYLNRK